MNKTDIMLRIQELYFKDPLIKRVIDTLAYKYKYDERLFIHSSPSKPPKLIPVLRFLMKTCYDELFLSIMNTLVENNKRLQDLLIEGYNRSFKAELTVETQSKEELDNLIENIKGVKSCQE